MAVNERAVGSVRLADAERDGVCVAGAGGIRDPDRVKSDSVWIVSESH